MRPLYLTQPIRDSLGACLKPGGEALTRRAIECIHPEPGNLIVDAGCGPGGGLSVLLEHGLRPIGLDLEYGLLRDAQNSESPLVQGDLESLPFVTASVDTIFCECAWNLTDKKQVLSEFYRVLRPGGSLVLSDIYLRGERRREVNNGWPITSCFSYATDLTTAENMVVESGLEVISIEDHVHLLKQTAAEFVFAHGSLQDFWKVVLGDDTMAKLACSASATTRPSLFLLIAKRSKE
jgi:ubiquinone/menaquinone biosynthesis C-methylase UbiE